MEKKIICVAELDADVDDVVAAEYLYKIGALKCLVLSPQPVSQKGKQRLNSLKHIGVEIRTQIPQEAEHVFVGGSLEAVANYLAAGNTLKTLIMNGGFVGANIVPEKDQLEKFKDQKQIRTFNFNCDMESTNAVLKSTKEQIQDIYLIGKNVCHSERNTADDFWKSDIYTKLFQKYNVRPGKKQHDLLAYFEGLCLLNIIEEKPHCEFMDVRPYNLGQNGIQTKWGSKKTDQSTEYRVVTAAVRLIK